MNTFKKLVGKTITAATLMKQPGFDDESYLKLEFAEGPPVYLHGTYGGYTGGSQDEYPELIHIEERRKIIKCLVPVE